MGVSLEKGGNVSLTKEAGGTLTDVSVALGWDERTTSGDDFDLDAMALVVGADGNVLEDKYFVFYGNLDTPNKEVHHTGDNLTGAGEGDDETIEVNLAALPSNAEKIIFPVNIYKAGERGQNFGQVSKAFIRVIDKATNTELARFDLSEDAGTDACVIFGEVYRKDGEWKLKAIEQGYPNGLADLATHHGVKIGG